MHLSYFYDAPFPSKQAAPIQILNTARALCETDVSVTVYVNRLEAPSAAACLDFYGLDPHEKLRIVPFFDGRPSGFTLRRRLKKILRGRTSAERHVVLSRGEPGLAVFKQISRIAPQPHERRVYEAHRLCFTEVAAWYRPRWLGAYRVARATAQTRRKEQRAVEAADGVLCLTSEVEAALREHFGLAAPTLVLPSGTGAPERPVPGDDKRDLDVLYAGKLAERKGVPDLVDAMRFLPDYRLHVVGGTEAEVEKLQRRADVQGVAGRVTLRGFVEPADVRLFYRRARVGVCPFPADHAVTSRFNSPLKVLNMMASGTPVVATDVPSVRALLQHERTALLVPPGDLEALAGAIRTLLEDRALAQRLAEAALEEVEAYTWPARARRLREFFEALP